MKSRMKIFFIVLTLTLIVSFKVFAAENSGPKIKNVILMIGDGMGPQQVSQAILYRKHKTPNADLLQFEEIHKTGIVSFMDTTSYKSITTDSASAATAFACGKKTYSGIIGMTPDLKPCSTLLEEASRKGKSTGLVSTTRLSHATPAAFAAHNVARDNENEIAEEIISNGLVDVLLNGGARHLIPQFKEDGKTPFKLSDKPSCKNIDPLVDGKSKRQDQKDLVALAESKNYEFVCTQNDLEKLPKKPGQSYCCG